MAYYIPKAGTTGSFTNAKKYEEADKSPEAYMAKIGGGPVTYAQKQQVPYSTSQQGVNSVQAPVVTPITPTGGNVSQAPTQGTVNAAPTNAVEQPANNQGAANTTVHPANDPNNLQGAVQNNSGAGANTGTNNQAQSNQQQASTQFAAAGQRDPIRDWGQQASADNLLNQVKDGWIHIADAQQQIFKQVEAAAMAGLESQIGTPEQIAAGTHISAEQAYQEAQAQAYIAFDLMGNAWADVQRKQQEQSAEDTSNALFPEFSEPEKVDQSVDIGSTPEILYTQINPTDYAFGYQQFMPTADEIQLTPEYLLAEKEGRRQLERLMSQRGHIGSGAEIDAYSNLLEDLLASETEKHREYADRQAGRATEIAQTEIQNRYGVALQTAANELQRRIKQGELDQSALSAEQYFELQKSIADNAFAQDLADRLATFMLDDADRDERQIDRDYQQIYDSVSLMLSQLPIAYAYGGSQGLAGLLGDEGDALAQWLSQIAQAGAGGGGGGGGGNSGAFPFIPSFPSGPNNSVVTPIQIGADLNSSGNWANLIWGGINSILGGSNKKKDDE